MRVHTATTYLVLCMGVKIRPQRSNIRGGPTRKKAQQDEHTNIQRTTLLTSRKTVTIDGKILRNIHRERSCGSTWWNSQRCVASMVSLRKTLSIEKYRFGVKPPSWFAIRCSIWERGKGADGEKKESETEIKIRRKWTTRRNHTPPQ